MESIQEAPKNEVAAESEVADHDVRGLAVGDLNIDSFTDNYTLVNRSAVKSMPTPSRFKKHFDIEQ
jgi:hypothetical protein